VAMLLFVIDFNVLPTEIITNAAHRHNHNLLFFNGKNVFCPCKTYGYYQAVLPSIKNAHKARKI